MDYGPNSKDPPLEVSTQMLSPQNYSMICATIGPLSLVELTTSTSFGITNSKTMEKTMDSFYAVSKMMEIKPNYKHSSSKTSLHSTNQSISQNYLKPHGLKVNSLHKSDSRKISLILAATMMDKSTN